MPKAQSTAQDSEGETEAPRSWDRGPQHQRGTMDIHRDMGAGVTRASKEKANIKGDGGGTPLQADITKADRHITEGGRRWVDSYLQGGTCPETGEQGGRTSNTLR